MTYACVGRSLVRRWKVAPSEAYNGEFSLCMLADMQELQEICIFLDAIKYILLFSSNQGVKFGVHCRLQGWSWGDALLPIPFTSYQQSVRSALEWRKIIILPRLLLDKMNLDLNDFRGQMQSLTCFFIIVRKSCNRKHYGMVLPPSLKYGPQFLCQAVQKK